jgi:folate-binding protein YgfZ
MISGVNLTPSYRPAALIWVTGEDAFTFLQGQFTNELRQPPGSATYGLWLNQKGKVLADSQVLRISENEFLIWSEFSPAAIIRQRLEEYIVADDVVLADETTASQALTLWGPGGNEAISRLLGATPAPGRFVRSRDLVVFRGRRLPGDNWEIFGPEKSLTEICSQLLAGGAVESSRAEGEFARISAGIPVVPADIGPGDLPNEGGLEDAAISYTKGCYLGQEVMARLKNLGQVRRRLHLVRGRGTPPVPLAALYQGEKKTGEIRTVGTRADEFVALAMVSLINLTPTAGISLEPAGPAVMTVDAHG